MEIPLEKATFTGHELHKKINKLFYMEIPLEKATFTGHELQKKINKLFYMEIPLEKATFTGHELQKKINKLFYMENPLEKATFTGHEYHKHGGRRSIAGIKESFKGKYRTCKTSAGVNLQGKSFEKFSLSFNF